MAEITANIQVAPGIFRMSVAGAYAGKMGQFYMLRAWDKTPLLSRPISIYSLDAEEIHFLYQVVGEGTRILSMLQAGDEITLEGPFGNGFPELNGKVALVGGGIGIAPFYYALQNIPQADVYLGFSQKPYEVDHFKRITDRVTVNVGGHILDLVDYEAYDAIFVCGPNAMMQAAQRLNERWSGRNKVYVSLENRMACGVGACLVCSVGTTSGRKKSCVDGPVFAVEEVKSW